MDTVIAPSYFTVCVFRLDFPYLDRFPALDSDAAISNIVPTVLKAIVGDSRHHLLTPFLELLSSDRECHPESFAASTTRHVYKNRRTKELERIHRSLRRRFSHTPITVLVTDTKEKKWAATARIEAMEHIIILEQRLVGLLRPGTPEARLFVFMTIYHEFAHLFRFWYTPHDFD